MWRIDRKASYLEWTIFILCCVISVGHKKKKKKLKNFKGEAFGRVRPMTDTFWAGRNGILMKERECLYVFLKIRIDEMSFLERKEKSLKRHQKSHTNIKVVVYQSFRLLLLLLLHSNHFFFVFFLFVLCARLCLCTATPTIDRQLNIELYIQLRAKSVCPV